MQPYRRQLPVILASLVAVITLFVLVRKPTTKPWQRGLIVTLGEIQTVHPDVRIGAREVRASARLAPDDVIATGSSGRGRIRLDDGTSLVLDRSTRVLTDAKGVGLQAGRVFAQGAPSARTEVRVGPATVVVSSSTLAFEVVPPSGARIYCVEGDSVVQVAGKQERLRAGETATLNGPELKIAPEKAFNDWTGGMAGAWGAAGRARAAIGELWGRSSAAGSDPGSPLAIRAHDVRVRLEGEVATTHVETTYFNAGSAPVFGDFRLALPVRAIVSRFAVKNRDGQRDGVVAVGAATGMKVPRLEWAGEGLLRGGVPDIPSGQEVTVIIEYVEWLPVATGTITYRYPMAAEEGAPLLGEFQARIDATGVHPLAVRAGAGAVARDGVIDLHRSDFRPQSDLVVEIDVAAPPRDAARAYVARPTGDGEFEDPYVLVRADVPQPRAGLGMGMGMALAIVVDTSWSIDPTLLDAERALVEAIVEGLGPTDQVVLLEADQTARPIGPSSLGTLDDARRKALLAALGDLRPGGATDLGAVLEYAAQRLPADAPQPVVLYVGDGEPTVGEPNPEEIRRRLERRAGGLPRVVPVAVGPAADTARLAALAGPREPLFRIESRADAARTAIDILVQALRPAALGVEIEAGPTIHWSYPRSAQTVFAGESATVVGRVRGELPREVTLRYRQLGQVVEQRLPLVRERTVHAGDIRRRWSQARIDELARRGESRETIVALAVGARLVTPWTGFYVRGGSEAVEATPLVARWLDRSLPTLPANIAPAALPLRRGRAGAILESPARRELSATTGPDDLRVLLTAAAHRVLEEAAPAVRKCQEMAAVFRPDMSGALRVSLTLDGSGRPSGLSVRALDPGARDPWLYRCVSTAIQSLSFFDVGTQLKVSVEHDYRLVPLRDPRKTQCSASAQLPLPVRRGIWSARLVERTSPQDVYLQAKQACELPGWADWRTLLELMLDHVGDPVERLTIARRLDEAREAEAARLLRRETIRRAANSAELARIRLALLGDEPAPGAEFRKQYAAAPSDDARLAIVRRFLAVAPHDSTLRSAAFVLLENLGRRDELLTELSTARQDPFSDIALLADAASTLRRLGRDKDAARAFGDILERSPFDPFVRAYIGDRLRSEGLLEEASAAYESFAALLPSDPTAGLRLGLAHAGAMRLDIAERMLARVAQTGGKTGDAKTGELAAITAAVLLAEARSKQETVGPTGTASDLIASLTRRALTLPLPDVAGVVLIRAPVVNHPVDVRLSRTADAKTESPADLDASPLGLTAVRLERGDRNLRIRLRRAAALASHAAKTEISLLRFHDDGSLPELLSRTVDLRADGKPVELRWDGSTLL